MKYKRTFIIGDSHGKVDSLDSLLTNAEIIRNKKRIDLDTKVIHLGDLGHFGDDKTQLNKDEDCYLRVLEDNWIDVVLWGNHDRAVVDSAHRFNGYRHPKLRLNQYMALMEDSGILKFAESANGYLLTHAGLHSAFDTEIPNDLDKAVEYLNENKDRAVINAISLSRGGLSPAGGILWRDIKEKLSKKFPQIFGHSAQHSGKVKILPTTIDSKPNYCIDIGSKNSLRLAGILLPEQKLIYA